MKPMGSCDGTSEYLGVCDATDGFVRCDDAGKVVRSKLFLGHFERHNFERHTDEDTVPVALDSSKLLSHLVVRTLAHTKTGRRTFL